MVTFPPSLLHVYLYPMRENQEKIKINKMMFFPFSFTIY